MLSPDYRDILSALIEERVDYLVVGTYAVASTDCQERPEISICGCDPTGERGPRVARTGKFGAPLSELTESELTSPGLVFQIGVELSRIDILTSMTRRKNG